MDSALWSLSWDKQIQSGRDLEIYAEVFVWILLINLTPNALLKLSGLPVLSSNNQYECKNDSFLEWLTQVVSVMGLPASLPSFSIIAIWNCYFSFSCCCDIHEIDQTIHSIIGSQNSPGWKGPQKIIWPSSINSQYEKARLALKTLTFIHKYIFSTRLLLCLVCELITFIRC